MLLRFEGRESQRKPNHGRERLSIYLLHLHGKPPFHRGWFVKGMANKKNVQDLS